MSTMQFIAEHNDRAASIEILQAKARSSYRAAVRSLYQANQARAQGDHITATWFDAEFEHYACKSDDSFAAALAAARGL